MLVDFGLVRQIGADAQMTATGVVMGTVDYIAPEQARGQHVDGRSDIYSLGVMFYQLLAGRLPFQAETPTAMIFQHAYEEPFPLAQAAPDVPQPVLEIIARMMAKDPAERYGSCAAVLADLRAFREGRPCSAHPPPLPDARGERKVPLPPGEGRGEGIFTRFRRGNVIPPPFRLCPATVPWQRAKDWAATMFRRHAPEALKELQSTTQQVDGAVAEHERRAKRLRGLLDEARGVVAELAVQIGATEQAAQELDAQAAKADVMPAEAIRDKLRACREDLAALHAQHDEQQQQVGQLEIELAKAEATLVRLRSQRDMLNARMKAVEAQQRMDGTTHSRRSRFRWNRKMSLAVAGTAAVILVAVLLLRRGEPPISPQTPAAVVPAPAAVVPAATAVVPAPVTAKSDALYAHDSFDLPVGTALNGQPGGDGFAGNWIGNPAFTIGSGSLVDPTGLMTTYGNCVTSGISGENKDVRIKLATPVGGPGRTVYFSWLLRPEGTVGAGFDFGHFGLVFIDSRGIYRGDLFVGRPGTAGNFPYVLETIGGGGSKSRR